MLAYIIIIAVLSVVFIVASFIYYDFKGIFRKNIMKKFAKELNLNFIEDKKNKQHYKIEGIYNGKNISIDELKYNHSLGDSYIVIKKVIINVNNNIIYDREEDVLFPSIKKVKRIINYYIENGFISKEKNIDSSYVMSSIELLFILTTAISIGLILLRLLLKQYLLV